LESVLLVFQPKPLPRPWRIEPGTKPICDPILLTRKPNPPTKKLPALDAKRKHTVSPVAAADPFRTHFEIPSDVDFAQCRVYLEMEGLPDDSASVSLNGTYLGGVIGRPLRLELTRHIKKGQNAIVIEPLAPKSASLVIYAEKQ
jgi:hypothetical protein